MDFYGFSEVVKARYVMYPVEPGSTAVHNKNTVPEKMITSLLDK